MARATESDMDTIIGGLAITRADRRPVARGVVLSLGMLGLAILLVTSVRLAMVIAGTPGGAWLIEFSPLISDDIFVDDRAVARAEWVAGFISDASLVTARTAPCRAQQANAITDVALAALDSAARQCLALVEDA